MRVYICEQLAASHAAVVVFCCIWVWYFTLLKGNTQERGVITAQVASERLSSHEWNNWIALGSSNHTHVCGQKCVNPLRPILSKDTACSWLLINGKEVCVSLTRPCQKQAAEVTVK